MSRIARVSSFDRVATSDGIDEDTVICGPGDGDDSGAAHYSAPGDDSPPLAGDFVQLVDDGGGPGTESAVGYMDLSPKSARQGEKRIYARNGDGEVVAEIWLKRDGTIVITNSGGKSFEMADNGDVTIRGNLIVQGDIASDGEVTAGGIPLSTHIHTAPSGGGTTSGPAPVPPEPP